jgi:transposase-like protein
VALIGIAEIARSHGVGESAVRNWLSRYKHGRREDAFPAPAGHGPDGAPLYEDAEVAAWVRRRGQRGSGEPAFIRWSLGPLLSVGEASRRAVEVALALIALVRLRPALPEELRAASDGRTAYEMVRRRALQAEAVEIGLDDVFSLFVADPGDRSSAMTGRLIAAVWPLLDALPSAPVSDAPPWSPRWLVDLFEALLLLRPRPQSGHVDDFRTPEAVRDLLVNLTRADRARAVIDPAVGEAGLLLAAERVAAAKGENARQGPLAGWEIDRTTWRIAKQRMLVHDIPAELHNGNSLSGLSLPGAYDAVVCDPPFNLPIPGLRAGDDRWRYGIPAESADLVWVQLAIHLLSEHGHAAVLLPDGAWSRGGADASIRLRLLEAGTIEALIALPQQADARSQQSVSIGLFRAPRQPAAPVLFIDVTHDAAGEPTTVADITDAVRTTIERFRGDVELPRTEVLAVTATPEEIHAADGDLRPQSWVYAQESKRLIAEIETAVKRLHDVEQTADRRELPVTRAAVRTRETVQVRQLVADGHLQLLSGIRHETHEQPAADRNSAWGPWSFRSEPTRRYAAAEGVTRPGDVIVMPSPAGVQALVDRDGGWVLVAPVQAIRIGQHARAQMNLEPNLVAAFLSDLNSLRSTGTTRRRVSINELELPVLDAHNAVRLQDAIARLEATIDAAATAARLRALLIAGVRSGAVDLD